MRRNDKDASHSQRLGQDQKFCTGGMESAAFPLFACLQTWSNIKSLSGGANPEWYPLIHSSYVVWIPACKIPVAVLVILKRTGTNLANTGKPLNSLEWLEMNPTCKRAKSACRHTEWTEQRACLGDDIVKVPCCPPGSSPGSTLNKRGAALNARCNFNSFHLKHSWQKSIISVEHFKQLQAVYLTVCCVMQGQDNHQKTSSHLFLPLSCFLCLSPTILSCFLLKLKLPLSTWMPACNRSPFSNLLMVSSAGKLHLKHSSIWFCVWQRVASLLFLLSSFARSSSLWRQHSRLLLYFYFATLYSKKGEIGSIAVILAWDNGAGLSTRWWSPWEHWKGTGIWDESAGTLLIKRELIPPLSGRS